MDDIEVLLDKAKASIGQTTDKKRDVDSIVSLPRLQDTLVAVTESETNIPLVKAKPVPSKNIAAAPETAGSKWFNLEAPEITPALKRDLQLLKMRHVLDPKRFYKKETSTPKFFAVGTIKEASDEFYSARINRKQRKQTLAEEILATKQDYFKSKYKQIQKSKQSGRKKHYKKVKDMRA